MHGTDGGNIAAGEVEKDLRAHHGRIFESVVQVELLEPDKGRVVVVLVEIDLEGLLDAGDGERGVALEANTHLVEGHAVTLHRCREVWVVWVVGVAGIEGVVPVAIGEGDSDFMDEGVIEEHIRFIGLRRPGAHGSDQIHHCENDRDPSSVSHRVPPSAISIDQTSGPCPSGVPNRRGGVGSSAPSRVDRFESSVTKSL